MILAINTLFSIQSQSRRNSKNFLVFFKTTTIMQNPLKNHNAKIVI